MNKVNTKMFDRFSCLIQHGTTIIYAVKIFPDKLGNYDIY